MTEPKIVIDTDIVSNIMRGGPLVEAYSQHLQGKLVSISFITVGELYFGAENAKWGEKRRKQLETTLRNFVVIPYDHDIAKCYGRIVAERKRMGRPILARMPGLPPVPSAIVFLWSRTTQKTLTE